MRARWPSPVRATALPTTGSGGGGGGAAGADTLDGKAGADTLIGGAGNDIYIVDVAGDVVTEAANEGTDLVKTALAPMR